jgi:hypothetical protein
MIRRYVFPSLGSSGGSSRCLHRTWPLTQPLWCYTPTLRRIVRCWRPCDQNLTVSFHATVGWTAAHLSVHPALKASSWRVSVSIQTERRIDRRCPHSDRWFIRCYCLLLLCLIHSSGITRKHIVGSSDGPCKLSFLHAVYQVHWRLHRWFILRCQFPSFSFAVLTLKK